MVMVVQAEVNAVSMARSVQRQAKILDPGLPVELGTMSKLLEADLAQPRFRALLLGTFAVTALLLAAVGIFGVVSYVVSRRKREVGIRIALGADVDSVQKLILVSGMSPVLTGVMVGVFAAFALARVLTNLVFEVETSDPLTFVGVAATLIGAALAATYIPALQAAKVEPMEVLRME